MRAACSFTSPSARCARRLGAAQPWLLRFRPYIDANTGRGPCTVLTNPRDAPGFAMEQPECDEPKFIKEIKDEKEQKEYVDELKEFFEMFVFIWRSLD